MKPRLTLDALAISVLAILAALIGLTILLGTQAGVRVSASLPGDGRIAPFHVITLTFSESVNPDLTESLIQIQPEIDGRITWRDSRTAQFASDQPFELDTVYKLTLHPGLVTESGRAIKRERSWEFSVRAPLVAYLLTSDNQSSIWAIDLNSEDPKRLTDESIRVISFDTSMRGDFIVFTALNENGGIDLWRVSREGNDAFLMLDCGRDRCTTPAVSPNGKRIAYSREAAGPAPDLPFGSPRIWLLDLETGQNGPVYEDQSILGYNPSWSPDSNKLASYNGIADQINMLDLSENTQYIFPSNTGGPVAWSPDSTKFLFTVVEQREDGLRTRVRLADLALNDTITLIGANDSRDHAYYSLAWSLNEERAVLGFRAGEDRPAQILWLFNPAILEGIIIADAEGYTYNSPQWDPWGNALVFQQFQLRGAYKPEIGLWRSGFIEPVILAEGLMPHWLP
jgi:Tol biopolymer transport system component